MVLAVSRPFRTTSAGEECRAQKNNAADDGDVKPDGASGRSFFKKSKDYSRFGAWPISTMENSILHNVTSGVERCDVLGATCTIDVLGVSKHRSAKEGHSRPKFDGTFVFSGRRISELSGDFLSTVKPHYNELVYNKSPL